MARRRKARAIRDSTLTNPPDDHLRQATNFHHVRGRYPQGYGSALTYARRYGLATLVGLVSETDDDGEASMPTRNRAKAADKAKPPAMDQPEPPAGLPKIDGIDYQTVTASNGKICVIATGNAREKRPLLEQAGFRWDGNRKLWWRYAA